MLFFEVFFEVFLMFFTLRSRKLPARMTLAACSMSGNRFVDGISLMVPVSLIISLLIGWLMPADHLCPSSAQQ
jgi:hypothetical protein